MLSDPPTSTLASQLPSALPSPVSSPQVRLQLRRKSVAAQVANTSLLARYLTVRDLTGLGVAAIIGAGIFSTIGKASAASGPAVALLFVFTAVTCAFLALYCAQFAAIIPVSSSADVDASSGELAAELLAGRSSWNMRWATSW
jgi:amino acid permease